jgi:hypothetical protein
MIAPEYVLHASLFPLIQCLGHGERQHISHGNCHRRARRRRTYAKAHLLELVYRRRQKRCIGMHLKELTIGRPLVARDGKNRRVRRNVREERDKFGGLSGVRDEEHHVVLLTVSTSSKTFSDDRSSMHLADIPQVSMQRLRCMHEATRNTEALHRRHRLSAHQPAFADAADNHLAASFASIRYRLDSLQQTIARVLVGLIEQRHLRQRRGGCRKHVDSA